MPETILVPYSFTKDGVYYFSRRIPSDLSHYYLAPRIQYSLRTKTARVAASRSQRAAQQLDEYWYHLRLRQKDLPGQHMLRQAREGAGLSPLAVVPQAMPQQPVSASVKLSEAVGIYQRLKGQGKSETFLRATERSCGYVIDAVKDKDITAYTRADANRFRDALIERGLVGSSITRIMGTVRAVINFAASELGVTINNPFTGVYYDRTAGVEDREPVPMDKLRELQAMCRAADDDARWLIALVSDTGMRLAEAAGLLRSDIVLDGPVPHVVVQEHPWRRLKTASSARKVPLVGESLWAAKRVLAHDASSKFAFPRYNKAERTNANSASAALNKWMKPHVPERCTMHSFRHSMRDRLRAVECPSDIVDQIGGWQTEGVGQGYGKGYPLEVLAKWMLAVA